MIELTRRDDWFDRLSAVIARHRSIPFEWGRSDCLCFTAEAIEAMTGHSFEFPEYSTAGEALRVMRERGNTSPHDVLAELLPEVTPALAMSGDVVGVMDDSDRLAAGVLVNGNIFAKDDLGLALLPRTRIMRAFKV